MSRRAKLLIAALFLVLLGIPVVYAILTWSIDSPLRFRCVAALPEDEATVTDLLFYQGLTQEAVALHLGVDVRTVQRRWQRARRKLDELLEPDAV